MACEVLMGQVVWIGWWHHGEDFASDLKGTLAFSLLYTNRKTIPYSNYKTPIGKMTAPVADSYSWGVQELPYAQMRFSIRLHLLNIHIIYVPVIIAVRIHLVVYCETGKRQCVVKWVKPLYLWSECCWFKPGLGSSADPSARPLTLGSLAPAMAGCSLETACSHLERACWGMWKENFTTRINKSFFIVICILWDWITGSLPFCLFVLFNKKGQ